MGKLFTLIPAGSIAFRVNLLSTSFGSLTALIIFLILLNLTDNDKRNSLTDYLVAAAGSLVLAFSYTFWYLSLVAEMYTIDAFFIALLVLLRFNRNLRRKDNPVLPLKYGFTCSVLLRALRLIRDLTNPITTSG